VSRKSAARLHASRQSWRRFFPLGSFTAELGLFRHACKEKRTAGELIWRPSTFPQREIQPGTGPDFPGRTKIFLDGSNLPGSAQNLFRRPEASWIRPKTFPSAAKLLGSVLSFLDPSQNFLAPPEDSWTRSKKLRTVAEPFRVAQKVFGPSQTSWTRPKILGAVQEISDRNAAGQAPR